MEAMLTTGKVLIVLIVSNCLYGVVDLCCGLPWPLCHESSPCSGCRSWTMSQYCNL